MSGQKLKASDDMSFNTERHLAMLFGDMFRALGSHITRESTILDFGCGEGKLVYALRRMGFNAFGVDIVNRCDDVLVRCNDEHISGPDVEVFRTIDPSAYRIPFDTASVDYVISWQVFEHVQCWPQALAEIQRVLRPGGCGLHVFPSRWRPIEAHVFVPFAGIFQAWPYLAFWSLLGVRNEFQGQLGWKQVATVNREYLTTHTNYLTRRAIERYIAAQFGAASFGEEVFIACSFGRLRHLRFIVRVVPFLAVLVSTFHTRVVFFRKQEDECELPRPGGGGTSCGHVSHTSLRQRIRRRGGVLR